MISNPLRDPRDRRLPRVPEPCALVVFGITGDLASKKLLPAVYDLANRGLLPTNFALLGFARRDWEDQDFAELSRTAAQKHARTPWREDVWEQLAADITFVQGSFDDDDAFDSLAATLGELESSHGIGGNAAFYLSIPPSLFPVVLKQMQRTGMAESTRRPVAPGRRREALRRGPALQPGAQRAGRLRLRRRRRLPDRPLPGQGDGPEPAGAALREHALRAHLERPPRRLGADHHGRGRRHRRAGAASTRRPARPATCCRTTCSSCWR